VNERQAHQESNPDQRGWSSRCSPLHHGPAKADGRGRASGRSRTCAATVRRVRAALDTTEALSRVETAESNPRHVPTEGCALPPFRRRDRHARARHTTACGQQTNRSKSSWLRRQPKPDFDREWRRQESNPHSLGASEVLSAVELRPQVTTKCERVESNHHSARQRRYRPRSSPDAQRSHERAVDRTRTGTAGITTPDAAVTPQPPRNGDDRARTGGLSVDSRAL
jgi:hypothetical protein